MKDMILGCILFLIAAVCFFLSLRSFREKGFLLNNAYLYASGPEREAMDKKPYYRQSGVVFLLIGCTLSLCAIGCLLRTEWVSIVAAAGGAVTVVYAIVSGIRIEMHKNRA